MSPKRSTHSERGFTIVEAMIGVLILGLVLLAWMSLEAFTARTVRRVSDFSAGQKVMITIMNDVLTAEKGLPAVPPENGDLVRANLSRAELQSVFASVKNFKTICYDRNAVLSSDTSKCYYFVRYFKYHVRDNSFDGSDLANVPLARVLVRIQYKDLNDAENQDAIPDNDIWKTRYMTRLVSNVADF